MRNGLKISLDCPGCGASIYAPPAWFKQPRFNCPSCAGPLTGVQFAEIVCAFEQTLAATVEERVADRPESDCCGQHSSCCGKPS